MRSLLLLLSLILGTQTINSQIKLGQDSQTIKKLLEWQVKESEKRDSYGNRQQKMELENIYKNGDLNEIKIIQNDRSFIDLKTKSSTITRYKMSNGVLSCITTQYKNLSLKSLQQKFDALYQKNKIDRFYFDKDYNTYQYLSLEDNLASVTLKKVDLLDFEEETRKSIKSRIESNSNSNSDYIEKDGFKKLNITNILKRTKSKSDISGYYEINNENVLQIIELNDNTVLFSLDLVSGNNLGYLEGLAYLKDEEALFKNEEFGLCEFKITFNTNKATIKTLNDGYYCGFGNGIVIDKIYTLNNMKKPIFKTKN